MLKGRGRDPRGGNSPAPFMRPVIMAQPRTPLPQRAPVKPEPDYEVVEFPSDQYVNAKLQPPPPPPPRPPTGHPAQAGASCGLCGGGGARVRCTECGRRALCASCDDMYHRHPKRRHHQRQALSQSQLSEDRPPLPPKVAPPVPPPRRNKLSASPKPPTPVQDPRRATLTHASLAAVAVGIRPQPTSMLNQAHPLHIQNKVPPTPQSHLGSMPFLNTLPHQAGPLQNQMQMHQMHTNTLGHMNAGWNRPRGSHQGFNMPQMQGGAEPWESPEATSPTRQVWGRGMRRGASFLELGGAAACPGCAHCGPVAWRYGSCASLDHPWPAPAWPGAAPPPACCAPQHMHPHHHTPQTPQPYRRAESRAASRGTSRAGSRAASPAMSTRSRASRRTRHRTPSPPLPSSDADSESESEKEPPPPARRSSRSTREPSPAPPPAAEERALGPPPSAPSAPWTCEHCTFVNEPNVRVCAVCCRTPTAAPRVVTDLADRVNGLEITRDRASPAGKSRIEVPAEKPKKTQSKKERSSTGCGPSPPREQRAPRKVTTPRTVTPTRERNGTENAERSRTRHDMAVGPSPPRDVRDSYHNVAAGASPQRESNKTLRVSPYRETQEVPVAPQRHSVSVGPSPPREARHSVSVGPSPPREARHSVSVGPSPPRETPRRSPMSVQNFQKKSAGTSPPRGVAAEGRSITKTNVSNTGTSPPPQSISTQTYEEAPWERAGSAARSRPRRRFRDDARRERSHSRHSLSSDTRESERSVRTSGAGWEWREASPARARLARRASHLDLYRARPRALRRDDYLGSEGASPEPLSGRAMSMEALSRPRDAARGLELARLLADAEKLGYNATEVQVALAQSPGAPLEWLRTRWAGLAGAVQGAVARLAGGAALSEQDARAALARHRGAVWPAVTDCVDALRSQESGRVSGEGRVRGRVWGSPAGHDDDAAPRARAEDSSDEYDPRRYLGEEWETLDDYERWSPAPEPAATEVARRLRALLAQAGMPSIDESLLVRGLLAARPTVERAVPPALDFLQSENDFIDAYNALTRASPLPNVGDAVGIVPETTPLHAKTERNPSSKNDERQIDNVTNVNGNDRMHSNKTGNATHNNEANQNTSKPELNNNILTGVQVKSVPKKEKIKIIQSENQIDRTEAADRLIQISDAPTTVDVQAPQRNEIKSPTQLTDVPPTIRPRVPVEEKSNNLNDIVDNTQKLIQQMKEEINSDITSLDEGHAQTSQSENESSSNDEREEESSYSETEAETDDVTSEERELSSEEDDNNEEEIARRSRSNATFPNRTSSEDNEEFEEALDNLDNQIEEVKHTNIEILNSIARSLQEEHTLSIETNEVKPNIIEKPVPTYVEESPINKEDSNNNLFVTVNSFEEIYAQLNNSKTNKIEKNETESPLPKIDQPRISPPKEPIILLAKYPINKLSLKIVTPTKLVISESKDPIFNAIVDIIQDETVYANQEETVDTNQEETNDENTNENQIEGETVTTDVNAEQIIERENSIELPSTPQHPHPSINDATDTITSKSAGSNSLLEKNEKVSEAAQTIVQTEITIVEANSTEHNVQRKSVEKVAENDNIVKTAPVKSNIPKPIKTQNIKAKGDKLTSKLISKVPVRKASVKQYPAPAPPKFGNVQSGHVKQLQSTVFNSTTPPKLQTPVVIDVKPSTSTATLTKKKQAPAPPVKQGDSKQSSPPSTSHPKEKRNNYFRETCRTEDEWTESDSEDSQSQVVKEETKKEVVPVSPPSPPPPLTLRRVSGQIIDLANVQLPEGSPERQARMLLAAGALESWEQAQLAVELVGRGAAPPAALLAALECADLPAALAYLHQDCELCASRLPEHEMVSMLRCTHRCCRECARLYFTVQITERSIADCVCPFCKLPELEALHEDAWLEYFAHLDILLKTLLETDVHELFQRKLRDRTLALDPNFRWCMECSSGFFVHPKQKKLRCPECRSVSCASCRKPWSSNHDGLSCEQYAAWLEDNDPEVSAAAVQQHLRENGLECPRCRFKYSLSRGGCMHFTCTQCKYEFCYGCGKPFTMGARCGLSEYCARLGLHAHHPRNCLFYLRDKEPHELQTLLQMNNVTYETEPAAGSTGRCPIQLQRETPAGLVDGVCGSEAPKNFAGLCKNHYLEYLCRAVRARGVDPLPLLSVDDLETLVRRAALRPPPRPYGSLDGLYKRALTEIVKEKIPLD